MAFYDLPKTERIKLVKSIRQYLLNDLKSGRSNKIIQHFSDNDTYIRKSAYLAIGKIYFEEEQLQKKIISLLKQLYKEKDFKLRQSTINAAGEIGKTVFEVVELFFDQGLFDSHHSVRNAVIGSIKKMGEKNPVPILNWAKKYLQHEDKEIRREICHGIELRGRTHPHDILPILKVLQFDKTARVKKTLVHVLGQISYKRNCLKTVIAHLKSWENKSLVEEALQEIIDVHDRYRNFAILTQQEAREYIKSNYYI